MIWRLRMVYVDRTEVYDITNASRFFTRPDSPNMIIRGNVLQESTQYKPLWHVI